MSPPSPSSDRQRPAPGMIRIGRIAGSQVLVSNSWFLVAALIAYLMAPRVDQVQPGLGGWKYLVGIIFAIALYGAILLHEASHALAARHYGLHVESITLHFLGGATAIVGEVRRPRQEFWIAVVGPITSLGVGAAALMVWLVMPAGISRLVVEGLAGANLVIGVMNLVPGLPLDGGRVLKAGVWALTGQATTGTTVAGWGGRVTALGGGVWALLTYDSNAPTRSLVLALVVMFLWFGASQAIASARVIRRFDDLQVPDLARGVLAVPEDLPLAEALRRSQESTHQPSIVTTTTDGRAVGIVDARALAATPEERWPWVAVSTVARTITEGMTVPSTITG
ncbi:MAG: site-2 protease family protein, partial [Nocardioidaceae bacterium]|nr:site-2 protease family protein [Nocardioidaceae bacterium]